jgi:hypothetical protein
VAGDGPEMLAAKRLLDDAKRQGFSFHRIAPGEDGSLRGVRESVQWREEIYIGGFSDATSCSAIRRRRSFLIVPGELLVTERVVGDAITVLYTVLYDWRITIS